MGKKVEFIRSDFFCVVSERVEIVMSMDCNMFLWNYYLFSPKLGGLKIQWKIDLQFGQVVEVGNRNKYKWFQYF